MSDDQIPACPVCSGAVDLLRRAHPGYRAPDTYDLYACPFCDLQFAWPFKAGGDIYEGIYRQPERVPGYARYAQYAREVASADRPLAHLASKEAMYWFVATAVAQQPVGATIIEVGSGYGYLTYSLVRAGFAAKGVDISENAVRAARARFGDHYQCEDIRRLAAQQPGSADVVVMTEVLEHLEEPLEILEAIKVLLKPSGIALITTPNRGVFSGDAIWRTDNPPVHLAWYSKTSLREMARRAQMGIRFQDFGALNREKVAGVPKEERDRVMEPILDADNSVREWAQADAARGGGKNWRDTRLPQLSRIERRRKFLRRALNLYARESEIIGAIFTKP